MQIWADIQNGAALRDPSLLTRALLLVYADLKKYIYYYWYADRGRGHGRPQILIHCACPQVCLSRPQH
jgi:hypothetical protein